MRLPKTSMRVERNTCPAAARRIRLNTQIRIEQALEEENGLAQALERLDEEWDTERVLETNAACLLLLSLGLGALRDRRWLWLTGGVAAFLLQHALQGWCPPLPIIRALGVRTSGEIGAERAALQALRGDFDGLSRSAGAALHAASPDGWE